jgi:hypothetical protein
MRSLNHTTIEPPRKHRDRKLPAFVGAKTNEETVEWLLMEALGRLVDALWYLTPITSLSSIWAYGVLSHHAILQAGLPHERIDWQSVQWNRNKYVQANNEAVFHLHEMVPLFFATHQPMLYVQDNKAVIAHLEIDPALLAVEGTYFSDGNAASNGTRFFYALEDLDELDWSVIRTPDCWSREYKRKKAAEVLAPSPVEPAWITRVHVMNNAARRSAMAQLRGRGVAVVVSPYLYES